MVTVQISYEPPSPLSLQPSTQPNSSPDQSQASYQTQGTQSPGTPTLEIDQSQVTYQTQGTYQTQASYQTQGTQTQEIQEIDQSQATYYTQGTQTQATQTQETGETLVTYQTPATSVLDEAPSQLPPLPSPFLSASIIPHIPPNRLRSNFNYYPMLSPGPDAKAQSSTKLHRFRSIFYKGLPMPIRPLPEVSNWIDQCFYCGQFGHRQNTSRCPDLMRPRTAEHYDDWRLVRFDSKTGPKKMYSMAAMWPGARAIEAAPVATEDTPMDVGEVVKEITDTTSPMVIDTSITLADQPPPIPWNTRPTLLGTQKRASVTTDDDEVFVDAGCACTCQVLD